ncbi:hypothetical protein [Homoserinimonas sp. OAct 916]|uniref:hypothetical protein n=1 Tax=Homoserinimonas sp. OAct 916 TaxID=2211450 RepID=UPI000DBE1B6D|nr:hypothetical protein [Homoserinimonas sp. OAct 916]
MATYLPLDLVPSPTVFGWVLLAVLAAAAAIQATIWSLRLRGTNARVPQEPDAVPRRIRALIQKLMVIRQQYLARVDAGDRTAPAVIGEVDSLVANVTELFRRLQVKADDTQSGHAQVEYEDKLSKLVAILDRDYLLDVLANPRLWDDPEQRMREAQGAIESVNAHLLDSIVKVNARRGMLCEVALQGLMGPRKAMDDWQRDFDKASGTT